MEMTTLFGVGLESGSRLWRNVRVSGIRCHSVNTICRFGSAMLTILPKVRWPRQRGKEEACRSRRMANGVESDRSCSIESCIIWICCVSIVRILLGYVAGEDPSITVPAFKVPAGKIHETLTWRVE